MQIKLDSITKEQSLIIKAFAIILIVYHNFFHVTNPIGENQMVFDAGRIFVFFDFIISNPAKIIDALFSYFGHYGVQLFIFISGYGLSKQFVDKGVVPFRRYILPRLRKIYLLMIFGLLVCFLFYWYEPATYFLFSALSLSTIRNFSYQYLFYGIGPWWYFGLAIQLYLIFPLLYKIVDRYGKKGFFAAMFGAYVLIYVLFPFTEKLEIPLYGNFVGHMPEFLLGIGLARIKELEINRKVLAGALCVFILSNFSSYVFPFSFLSVTLLMVSGVYVLIRKLPSEIYKSLTFIGSISMFIFIINSPVRNFVQGINITPLLMLILFSVIVLVVSYIMSLLYCRIIVFLNTRLGLAL